METRLVRVVQERRNQAHRRAHDCDGGADDCCFKQYGVGRAWVEDLGRQLEG